jgi:hypothetical protein
MIIASAAVYFYLRNNALPAAIVNYNFISQTDVNNYYNMSKNYLVLVSNSDSDMQILEATSTQKEIKRAVIEKLIENKLIYNEAKKRAGNDLESIANQKIQNALNGNDISDAINKMFGISVDSYIKEELKPDAYKEILQGRMTLTGENFDNWLENAKNNAKVLILLPGYSWDGKNVKITQ